MSEPQWIEVGPADELTQDGKACVKAGQTPLVVCTVEGETHVLKDECPHAGLPFGEGELRGKTLTCPFHGFTYRVDTGADVDDPEFGEPAAVLPCKVESGKLWVRLESS